MDRGRCYRTLIILLISLILIHFSIGRPVAAVRDELTLPLVADPSPTSIVVGATHVPQLVGDPSPPAAVAHLSGADSSNTIDSVQLSKQSDSDTKVAVPTVVGIAVFLALFIGIQFCLWCVAVGKVDVFHSMKRTVHHAAPLPTARGYMSRTSLRSASFASDTSDASTLCAVPIKGVCLPAPVVVEDSSSARW